MGTTSGGEGPCAGDSDSTGRTSAPVRGRADASRRARLLLLGLALQRGTDSDVPFLDALPTVGSVAGQLLLGRKLIENWPVWFAVNVVSVVLFAWKALWLTMLVYAVFALLSLLGWRAWRGLPEAKIR